MKSIYLLAIASSFVFELGLSANHAIAAIQPDRQGVIDAPANVLPPVSPRIDSPDRNLTTDELFQRQQNRWQHQQELWQEKQTLWQNRMDMQLQQQNQQQLREIQRQQEFIIRGKYPSILRN
jgi:hypothetical protein